MFFSLGVFIIATRSHEAASIPFSRRAGADNAVSEFASKNRIINRQDDAAP